MKTRKTVRRKGATMRAQKKRANRGPLRSVDEQRREIEAKMALLGDDAYLTPAQVAVLLSVQLSTLESWRRAGKGPAFVSISKTRCGYRAAAVRDYLRSMEVASTTEAQKRREQAAEGRQASVASASTTGS